MRPKRHSLEHEVSIVDVCMVWSLQLELACAIVICIECKAVRLKYA
jgi:hypothetical protein